VAYLLIARTVEPEKQPLLANGSETTFISRQQPWNRQQNDVRCWGSRFLINGVTQPIVGRREHIPMEVISIWEWAVLSMQSVPRNYKEDNWANHISSVWESVRKRVSWNGVTIQKAHERGSWRISTLIWMSGGTAPPFSTSALYGGEWSTSHPCCFAPRQKCHWHPSERRLGGPQSQSGCCGEEKNVALLGIKPGLSSL
jgi:hypothetical protein